jgi:DNA-binding IclR family transcriptional regulator
VGATAVRLGLTPYTPSTIVHPAALVERIQSDHEQGFSIVDEVLERALRSESRSRS